LHQGLKGYFYGNFLALIVSIPLGFWFIQKELKLQFDKILAKEILLFGYPFIFAGLAYWIFGSMDRWMLGELSDNTQVGLYSIAFKIASVLSFFNLAFSQAWSPFVIKLYAENPNYRRILSQIFSYLFFGFAFIGILIGVFGFEVLKLTTPQEYWPAATTLIVVVMGIVLYSTTQITVIGISLEKKTYLLGIGSWITAIINFVLNLFLIPEFGALGTATATFISYFVLSSYYLYWTQKLHPIPLEVKKLIFTFSIVLLSIIFSFYVNHLEWSIKIIILKLLFCISVIFMGFAVKIINISDIRKLVKK
jgi:O-antigen/teichoic acid export membrane protein